MSSECPICMEPIVSGANTCVTECGHSFHCRCLMQNSAHNGFSCPYCRTALADEPKDDETDVNSVYSDETAFDEDALVSFRMFHQRIEGEEVEEEPAEEWETVADEDEVNENETAIPDAEEIASELVTKGFTMADLVKNLLIGDHPDAVKSDHLELYDRRGMEVYGQIRAILSQRLNNSRVTSAINI
jgi:hypothetical protein